MFRAVLTFGEVQAFRVHFTGSQRILESYLRNVILLSPAMYMAYMAEGEHGGEGGYLFQAVCTFGYSTNILWFRQVARDYSKLWI